MGKTRLAWERPRDRQTGNTHVHFWEVTIMGSLCIFEGMWERGLKIIWGFSPLSSLAQEGFMEGSGGCLNKGPRIHQLMETTF